MSATNNAGSIGSIKKFDGKHYAVYKFQVQMYLESQDLWDAVERPDELVEELVAEARAGAMKGTFEAAAAQAAAEAKVGRLQRKAMSIITLTMAPEEVIHIMKCATPAAMLEALDARHFDKSLTNKLLLKEKFFTSHMQEGDNLLKHIENMDQILQELENIGSGIADEDAALFLLISLPPSFNALKTSMKVSNKSLTMEQVKVALKAEDRERNRAVDVGAAFAAAYPRVPSGPGRGRGRGGARPNTTPNTTPTTPNNVKKGGDKNKEEGANKDQHRGCFVCGSDSHKSYDCPRGHYNKKGGRNEGALCVVSVATVAVATSDITNILVDSGASRHMSCVRAHFRDMRLADPDHRVRTASGALLKVCGVGNIPLAFQANGNIIDKILVDVLFVPDLGMNLFSVSQAQNKGVSTFFRANQSDCTLASNGEIFGKGVNNGDGVFRLNCKFVCNSDLAAQTAIVPAQVEAPLPVDMLQVWHVRLGHVGIQKLSTLARAGMLVGVDPQGPFQLAPCAICAKGKMVRKGVGQTPVSRAEELGELFHSDLTGVMPEPSWGGARVCAGFTDDKSRFTFLYFLTAKSETGAAFKELKALCDAKGRHIKRFRADRGGEFTGKAFQKFLRSEGITPELSASHTPEQNGVAERKWRTVVALARCMLLQAGLSVCFWAEAMWFANYICNLMPMPANEGSLSPYEIWEGLKPDFTGLHTFGCKAEVLIEGRHLSKFESRTVSCLYLGPASDGAGDRFWNLLSRKIIISRVANFFEEGVDPVISTKLVGLLDQINGDNLDKSEVEFFDDDFYPLENFVPVSQVAGEAQQQTARISPSPPAPPNLPVPFEVVVPLIPKEAATHPTNSIRQIDLGVGKEPHTQREEVVSPESDLGGDPDCDGEEDEPPEMLSDDEDEEDEMDDPPLRQSRRFPSIPRRSGRIATPTDWYGDFGAASAEYVVAAAHAPDPKTVREAQSSPAAPKWQAAMETELRNLERNNTFELVDLPPGRKAVGCKWVFKTKYLADGTFDKHKARLVAKGFTQKKGFDFDETFAPVMRLTSFRVLLAVAAYLGLEIDQADIVSAFLNGKADVEIFMSQPPGFEEPGAAHKVWRLNKSIYGLKQASRIWYDVIKNFLLEQGFKQCQGDPCIFYIRGHPVWGDAFIGLYVDDFILVGNARFRSDFKKLLFAKFEGKDLGPAKSVIGLEINQTPNGIWLSQSNYILSIAREAGLADANSVATPMTGGDVGVVESGNGIPAANPSAYRSLFGKLMYAMVGSRPDIAFAVGFLGRFLKAPTTQLEAMAKRVVRYLIGTADYGIFFERGGAIPLISFADSNWGGDRLDRRSTGGFVFKIGISPISWSSKKMPTIALSSTEAEYMQATLATKEAIWLRRLLCELGFAQPNPTPIWEDNKGCIDLSRNPVHHDRTKHIDIQWHFVRESVEAGKICLHYIRTDEQVADIMTKPLARPIFVKLVELMGLKHRP